MHLINFLVERLKKRYLNLLYSPFFLILILITICTEVYCFYSLIANGIHKHIIFLALLGLFPIISAMFWVLLRGLSPDHVVVWLRRFHQHEKSRFPMVKYLLLAAFMRFQVVTIQDTKFQRSYMTGYRESFGLILFVQLMMIIPCFLLSAYLVRNLIGLNDAAQRGAFSYQFITTIALFPLLQASVTLPIIFIIARKRGFQQVLNNKGIDKIVKWIDNAHNGGNIVSGFFSGLKIFKCGDNIWNDAVQLMLAKCDAVIIDVSNLNENMRWELTQCVQKLQAEKVVLAYSVDLNSFPDRPSDALVNEIEQLIGFESLKKVRFLPYPEPIPLKRGRPFLDLDLDSYCADSFYKVFNSLLNKRRKKRIKYSMVQ